MGKERDLAGLRFNKLIVIKKAETKRSRGTEWVCLCDCGTEKTIPGSSLTRKTDPIKSCGCLKHVKTGGRIAYTGNCVLCKTPESIRWYKKCIKEGTICRQCYQIERLKDDNIRAKRNKNRKAWGLKNPYASAKRLAVGKEREFTLTEEEYVFKTNECYYCGDDLAKIHEGIKLDRIDSNIGYTNENTVGCCRMCNVAKNNYTLEEFYNWIKRLRPDKIKELLLK